jgi:curved DNA-binding protein CbpA
MRERDYYEVLQLHPKADHEIVAQAYWHLARKYNLAGAFDVTAKKKLEYLNEAFAVIGSPERRVEYDRWRTERLAATGQLAKDGSPLQKRVTIEVSFWRLPAWQGTIAAIGTLALAVVALLASASPIITLVLAAIAITAALAPTQEEWKPLLSNIGDWDVRGERELRAHELQQSTSAILARWREQTPNQARPRSLAQILAGTDQRFNRRQDTPPNDTADR